jgi:hypothetical protein
MILQGYNSIPILNSAESWRAGVLACRQGQIRIAFSELGFAELVLTTSSVTAHAVPPSPPAGKAFRGNLQRWMFIDTILNRPHSQSPTAIKNKNISCSEKNLPFKIGTNVCNIRTSVLYWRQEAYFS